MINDAHFSVSVHGIRKIETECHKLTTHGCSGVSLYMWGDEGEILITTLFFNDSEMAKRISDAINKAAQPEGMVDFTHIAMLGGPPLILVAHPSFPANNLQELVAYAQKNKDGLIWGSSGQGTHSQLIGEVFAKQSKYKQTHVGYKGAGPAINDLLGNHIPVAFVTLTAANAFVREGRLKAFAVTSARRMPDLLGVPTFTELGYPDLVATTWFGVSGPPGMPPALVDRINAEIRKNLKTEAMQKMMADEGIQSQDWDAATFTHYVRSEIDRWIPVVQYVAK